MLRRTLFAVLATGLLLTAPVARPWAAAEEVTLSSPVTKASQTKCKLDRVTITVTPPVSIYIQVLGDNGDAASKVYDATTTPTGQALLTTLNTANLTSNSLVRRIFTRLNADGICVGPVVGTPQ